MLRRVGHKSVLIFWLVSSRLCMFLSNMHHMIPREQFLDCLKKVLAPDTFKAFLHGSIFDKTTFC